MANLILFHSVLGLRAGERHLAQRLRTAGHTVTLPDLYAGAFTDDLGEGFKIKERNGWGTVCQRAHDALAPLPADTVLAGISMGAGVVAECWPQRPAAAKVLLLHGLADVPANARPGTPVQLHLAQGDPFFPGPDVRAWRDAARALLGDVQVFRYSGAGHYFSDPALADFDANAAEQLWERVLTFLG